MYQIKILSNGLRVIIESCGKQTKTQVFDNIGNLLVTRMKKISGHSVSPIVRKSLGFTFDNTTQPKAKEVITITKNTFDSRTKSSNASILDSVYKDGIKLGERRLWTYADSQEPMEAMNALKARENYRKELRLFENGKVAKDNIYEYTDRLRSTRTIYNYKEYATWSKKMSDLEEELRDLYKRPKKNKEKIQEMRNKLNMLDALRPPKEDFTEFLGAHLKASIDGFVFTI